MIENAAISDLALEVMQTVLASGDEAQSIMEKRDTVARMFASMAVWVARRGATIDNLEGTADGFGIIVNGTSARADLGELCELMGEVIEATSVRLQLGEDSGDA